MRVPTEFVQVEARGASYTRDSMVLAVGEEEQALLGGEKPRALGVAMGQPAPAAADGACPVPESKVRKQSWGIFPVRCASAPSGARARLSARTSRISRMGTWWRMVGEPRETQRARAVREELPAERVRKRP